MTTATRQRRTAICMLGTKYWLISGIQCLKPKKTFNSLLEQFRNDILPDVIDNWNELNEKQKTLCSKMNNFFCDLHLLVGLADSCAESLKKFELLFMDGKYIGSAIQS